LGAQIVRGRGLKAEELRERLAKNPRPVSFRKPSLPVLEDFLTGLKCRSSNDLMSFFAENAQVVDVHGKRWNHEEIVKNFETLFIPYAKKNATYVIEKTLVDSNDHLVLLCYKSSQPSSATKRTGAELSDETSGNFDS
jgi:hypothetical protein